MPELLSHVVESSVARLNRFPLQMSSQHPHEPGQAALYAETPRCPSHPKRFLP